METDHDLEIDYPYQQSISTGAQALRVPYGLSLKENSVRHIQQPQSEDHSIYKPCFNTRQNSYSTVVGGNNNSRRTYTTTRTSNTEESVRHYVPEYPETLINNNVSSVPITNTGNNQINSQPTPSSAPSTQAESLEINNSGVSFERPKHPTLAIPVARINTFKYWPKDFVVNIQELSEAGFFNTGKEDTTVCFYCGQGLNNWEVGDRPWTEHARWSPHCTHVLNVKGPDFVKQVLQFANNPEKLREIDDKFKQPDTPPTKTRKYELDSCSREAETSVDHLLDCPAARSVLSLEIETKLVKSAIQHLLKKNGKCHSFNATELMEIVLDIQDGKIKPEEFATKEDTSKRNPELDTDCSHKSENPDPLGCSRPQQEEILKENRSLKEQIRCKVCLDKTVCIVFLPCGHLCTCAECAPALKDCPVCRKFIRGTVKTYMA